MYIDKLYTKLFSDKNWEGLRQLREEVHAFANKDYKNLTESEKSRLRDKRDSIARKLNRIRNTNNKASDGDLFERNVTHGINLENAESEARNAREDINNVHNAKVAKLAELNNPKRFWHSKDRHAKDLINYYDKLEGVNSMLTGNGEQLNGIDSFGIHEGSLDNYRYNPSYRY